MAIRLGPKIDLTNVVLNLDAANPSSYNGIGSTWYDLSGNSNHFTLQGNSLPQTDGKKLSFNTGTDAGKNQYAICSNSTLGNFGTSSFTIEILANVPIQADPTGSSYALLANKPKWYEGSYGDGQQGMVINITRQTKFTDNGFIPNNGSILFGNFSTDGSNYTDIFVPNTNAYHVYTIERSGGAPPPAGINISTNYAVTAKFYKNTILTTTKNYNLAQTSGSFYTTANGKIDGVYAMNLMNGAEGSIGTGSIYTIKMYNRILSQSEIAENYQIYRQYYGF